METDNQTYRPGDVLSLRPRNLPDQVEEFKSVLLENRVVIPPDTVFRLTPNEPELPVPDVLNYDVRFDQLCSEYFDLMSIPRRHVFRILAQLTDSELEKEKCLEFASAEGQEDFFSYAYRPKRNIVEVLNDFPNATKNLTKEMLFEILCPIKARDFSIASNYKVHSNEVHVLLAVVKYKTKLKKERLGLASNYLAGLEKGRKLTAWIKPGSFRFPSDSVSKILIFRKYFNIKKIFSRVFSSVVNIIIVSSVSSRFSLARRRLSSGFSRSNLPHLDFSRFSRRLEYFVIWFFLVVLFGWLPGSSLSS